MSLEERYLQSHERRLDDLEDLLRELIQRSYAPAFAGPPTAGGGPTIRVGRATANITASTGTGPGVGYAQPTAVNGSGNYVDVGAVVAVRNAGAAISSGKRVMILEDADGVLWATPEEC